MSASTISANIIAQRALRNRVEQTTQQTTQVSHKPDIIDTVSYGVVLIIIICVAILISKL